MDFQGHECKANVLFAQVGKRPLYEFHTDGTLVADANMIDRRDSEKKLRRRFVDALVAAKFCERPTPDQGWLETNVTEWMEKLPLFEEVLTRVIKSPEI